jgi:hypothetical protein
MSDAPSPQTRSRRLADIVREVKVAAADRSDVVVEMRDADRARLELLAQHLEPVIKDIPADDDQFDFALSSGLEPRFWIDSVAHVHMGRDRRTYRVVRDTRLGRTLLAETADLEEAADAVSRYIAERLIQRQRILEGDLESLRAHYGLQQEPRKTQAVPAATAAPAPVALPAERPQSTRPPLFLASLIWFFVGCIIGGLALLAAFADRLSG